MAHTLIWGTLKKSGLLLLAAVLLCSCRGQKGTDRDTDVLVGTIYVTGNEPFTTLAVRAEDGKVRLLKKDTTEIFKALWKHQGKKLRIRFRSTVGISDSSHIIVEHFDLVKD